MSELLTWLLACVAGLALGVIFFAGLWWTISRAIGARQPALWFFGSFLVRMAVVLCGLYVIADGQWQRLLAGLVGLVLARLIVVRLVAALPDGQSWRGREAGDAP